MLFVSHTWRADEEGRNTHARVRSLVNYLQQAGVKVWFDEEMLKYGNIDTAMADGIDSCTHFLACLTVKYINKVNNGVRQNPMIDNCAKEFNYAMVRGKPIIPLILESAALDSRKWTPGIVSFYANHFHLYAIDDDWKKYSTMIRGVTRSNIHNPALKTTQSPLPPILPPICRKNTVQQKTPRQSIFLWNCRRSLNLV